MLNIYQFYMNSAVQRAALKTTQKCLGLPENLLLRHVNCLWLTMSPALGRLIEHEAIKITVLDAEEKARPGGIIYRSLKEDLMRKVLLPNAIFLQNVADSELSQCFISCLKK